jgi:hypothetical protein
VIFDAIIVGETPAAMMVAALLVRKGLKVAWVVPSFGRDRKVGKHPKVPDIVWDLLPQPLVREVLERLGVPYKHLEKSERQGGGIQMVAPEFRTASLDGIHEIRKELKRIFGLNNADLDKLFPRIQEGETDEFLKKHGGMALKRSGVRKAQSLSLLSPGESVAPSLFQIEGLRVEPALRRFFELAIYAQSYVCQWVFPKSLVKHFLYNMSHLNLFAQGRLVSPEEIFREVFQMGGGKIFPASKEIFLESHREKGVSFWIDKDEVVNGTVCLIAVSPDEAPEVFEQLHISHKRWRLREGEEEAYGIATILFSIKSMGVPGGMGDNLMLYTGSATDAFTPPDLAYLTLEKAKEAGELDGYYTVFYEGDLEEGETDAWGQRQISRLESIFPFMTSHIHLKEVALPGGHPLSSARYYYGATRKRRLGAPRLKEGLFGKNFYCIGRQQLDYMGLEGEIITAFKAFQWAIDWLAKL